MIDDRLNNHCAENPAPGDYWHEMFSPVCVVLMTVGNTVIYCEDTKPAGDKRWSWDIGRLKCATRAEFSKHLHYDGESMKHKCHCDVVPEGHKTTADYWRNQDTTNQEQD